MLSTNRTPVKVSTDGVVSSAADYYLLNNCKDGYGVGVQKSSLYFGRVGDTLKNESTYKQRPTCTISAMNWQDTGKPKIFAIQTVEEKVKFLGGLHQLVKTGVDSSS